MSTPGKHHYVPQAYLRPFADHQEKFYQYRKQYGKIAQKGIVQICYERDYFKIKREETKQVNGISDPYHIEKKAFQKGENAYGKLLKRFMATSLHPFTVPKTEVEAFLEVLITIKRRNPTVRQLLSNTLKEYVNSKQFLKELEPGIELSKRIDTIDPEEYIKGYIKTINTEDTKLSDLYLSRFLDKEQRLIKDVTATLLAPKLYIYHAPMGSQFMTSDNPGFVRVEDQLLNFGGLDDVFSFYFPLSPHHCLVINSRERSDPFSIHKTVYPYHTNTATVAAINEDTFRLAMDKVFAYSKVSLITLEESSKIH
jgi:hypothetical protein